MIATESEEPAIGHESASSPSPLVQVFQSSLKAIPTLCVLALLVAVWCAVHEFDTGGDSHAESESNGAPAEKGLEKGLETGLLSLPVGKTKAAQIGSTPVDFQWIQPMHIVPGRIRYDETQHIEVKSPIGGIVGEILVTPGESVTQGQLLAVISSPEIGQARAEIKKRQQQLELSDQQLDRETTLANNLDEFLNLLDQGADVDSIGSRFANRSLGRFRQELLSSHSKYELANRNAENITSLGDTGAVAGRIVMERQSERQVALANFQTARDQATFQSSQAKLKAVADVADAKRQLDIARETLATLLGHADQTDAEEIDALSRLEVRAPFAGSIESRTFARNERVLVGDALFVLANTESLYVEADIRESDWPAVALTAGTVLKVSVPALGDQKLEATVNYVGREVDANSNSIPLVAKIDNSESLLRPGMFVRAAVPMGAARQALSVKPESVIQHENQPFVFLDLSGGMFQRVDVETGLASEEWIEVTSGLQPGQKVVDQGAFLLKSELLLEGEE